MTELQSRLLEMLKWFHEFCTKNNLTYYAVGGTTLGAVRHNGFIPWDDDIDVGLPRPDYEKLKQIAKDKVNEKTKYYIEFPSDKKEYAASYGKMYDTTTTLIENTRFKAKRGIYIDIYPIDGIGNSYKEALKRFKRAKRYINLLYFKVCEVNSKRKWYKNLLIYFSHMIPDFVLDHKKIAHKIEQIGKECDFYSSEYVANIPGNAFEKEIILRELFGKPTLHAFESIEIYIPEKWNDFLTAIYGNWKQLPSKDKQRSEHDYLYLNLHKSYLD